jgi:hypothetical protein
MYEYIRECLEVMQTRAIYMQSSASTALKKFNDTWAPMFFSHHARYFVRLFMATLSGSQEPIIWSRRNSNAQNEEIKEETLKWFYKWGAEYLINNNIITNTSVAALSALLNQQWGHFVAKSSPELKEVFASFKFHLCHLTQQGLQEVNEALIDNGMIRKINYTTHAEDAAIFALARVCYNKAFATAITAILRIVPSEAAVERTFSAQGLIQTDIRNRLSDDTVMDELTIKFNQRALYEDINQLHIAHVRELDVDAEYDDSDNEDELNAEDAEDDDVNN